MQWPGKPLQITAEPGQLEQQENKIARPAFTPLINKGAQKTAFDDLQQTVHAHFLLIRAKRTSVMAAADK
jgi:hypothetical protein